VSEEVAEDDGDEDEVADAEEGDADDADGEVVLLTTATGDGLWAVATPIPSAITAASEAAPTAKKRGFRLCTREECLAQLGEGCESRSAFRGFSKLRRLQP